MHPFHPLRLPAVARSPHLILRGWGMALLLLALLVGCNPAPTEETSISVAQGIATVTPGAAPTLALPTLDGPPQSLETWRGKGIILNFWATWCYPCRTEMPALAAIHEQGEEVVVVGVSYQEHPDLARPFVEELALPFPILMDEEGVLAKELGVRALPTTFFINAEGQIVGNHLGPLDLDTLQEIVADLKPTE